MSQELSLNRLSSYLLNHPKYVDLKEYPACYISGREFPTRIGIYNQTGHKDIWEIIIPLFESSSFKIDGDMHVYLDGPFLKIYLFANELKNISNVIDELLEEIEEAKNFTAMASQFPTSKRAQRLPS